MNVDFVTAIKLFFANYANFKGRSTRAEYWWAMLFIFIASLIFEFIPFLSGIFTLAVLIPQLAIVTRRFHDIGRSGWWVLWFNVVYLLTIAVFWGSMLPEMIKVAAGMADPMALANSITANSGSLAIGSIICLVIGVWCLIWLVKPSGPDNQYGPNPYGGN